MKKFMCGLLALLCAGHSLIAQTKVFKEVSEEMSSQVATLWQDHTVIGYIAFTRLEKASETLYNYKVSIMDENLNDIGTVNFKEEGIVLQGIAFEQDVLCLAYFKSNMFDKKYKKLKKLEADKGNLKHQVMLQFLNLEGKIIETVSSPVDINTTGVLYVDGYRNSGKLNKRLQLLAVPQHGFACFFGDAKANQLFFYNPSGKHLWKKIIKEDIKHDINMISSGNDLFMIAEGSKNKNIKKTWEPNSYELLSFNVKDSSAYSNIQIKDKQNHQLSILTFDIDPSSGKPYLSGTLTGTRKGVNRYSVDGISKGYYAGLFTIDFLGHSSKETKEQFSYWDNKSNPEISHRGRLVEKKTYPIFHTSFRDFAGNTYFTADGFKKRARIGCITSSIILAPLLVPSIAILSFGGTQKGKIVDPVLLKLDSKGKFSYSMPFEGERTRYVNSGFIHTYKRQYYTAVNQEKKQQHLIVSEQKSSSIYDINTKKLVRNVPLKDKNITRAIFPAKEGSILISEYNKNEKYTRISIETL